MITKICIYQPLYRFWKIYNLELSKFETCTIKYKNKGYYYKQMQNIKNYFIVTITALTTISGIFAVTSILYAQNDSLSAIQNINPDSSISMNSKSRSPTGFWASLETESRAHYNGWGLPFFPNE